eukprot:4545719-Lingulodinium_polyedra.AAC.1
MVADAQRERVLCSAGILPRRQASWRGSEPLLARAAAGSSGRCLAGSAWVCPATRLASKCKWPQH